MGLVGGFEILMDMKCQGLKVQSVMAKQKIQRIVSSVPHDQKKELRAYLLGTS